MSTNYINKITATNGTTYDIAEGVDTRLFRATCSTTAATAAKVATLEDSTGFSLAAGVRVMVTFTYGNSAATPTLRVDGSSTGTAKTIATPTAAGTLTVGNGTTYNTWGPYETVIFTYNGTYWVKGGTGYAIYKAYANSGTDAKLQVGEVTSGTLYYPIVGTGTTAATRQYDTTGFTYKGTSGTTSSEGSASLTLGNNLDLSTAGNKTGEITLMGIGGDYVKIRPQYTTGVSAGISLYNNIGGDTYTYLLPPLEDTGGESGEALIVDNQHNQTIFGEKIFKALEVHADNGVPAIYFLAGSPIDKKTGGVILFAKGGNGESLTRCLIRQYSYDSSSLARLSYYENYNLPDTTSDLSANANYNILTTKNLVTIAQGGTGQSTAVNALNALGAKRIFANISVSSSSSQTLTLDSTYSGYHAGIVVGIVQGVGGVCLGFASGTSTTSVTVRNLVGNTSWSNNTLKFALSSNKLTLTSTNSSPSIVTVYAT